MFISRKLIQTAIFSSSMFAVLTMKCRSRTYASEEQWNFVLHSCVISVIYLFIKNHMSTIVIDLYYIECISFSHTLTLCENLILCMNDRHVLPWRCNRSVTVDSRSLHKQLTHFHTCAYLGYPCGSLFGWFTVAFPIHAVDQ